MSNSNKNKGDKAERELAALLAELTGWPVRRKLGAGRLDDVGDLDGIPLTTVQVKNYPSNYVRSIREGIEDLKLNQANSGDPYGVLFVRRRGGIWLACQTPEQWAALAKAAIDDG